MEQKPRLALFDFDGTITNKDTLFEFIKYAKGNVQFMLGFVVLSPILVAYKLGLLSNQRAKEITLSYFFNGIPLEEFQHQCDSFGQTIIPRLTRASALRTIVQHQLIGDRVIVVSASPENWLQQWCKDNHLEYLATHLEVKNNKITGRLEGKNCHGAEKVNRIKALLDLIDYREIWAYGDSSGDREMLAVANHPNFKPFRS